MLLSKEVEVRWHPKNKDRYVKLGYEFTKMKDSFIIKIEHLSLGSDFLVEYICDYCGEKKEKKYDVYNKNRKKIPTDCCGDRECQQQKRIESNMKFHGVENAIERQDVKNKIAQTNIERYGVDNPFKLKHFQDKAREKIFEIYGVGNTFQSEIIKEASRKTLLEKTGYEYSMQNPDTIAKVLKTKREKYGTTFRNGHIFVNGICASKAQYELGKHLGGEINKTIQDIFVVDIFIEPDIIIEYDGSGHDLGVRLGSISKEEFLLKEDLRDKSLLKLGYRILRVVNNKDDKFSYEDISDWILENEIRYDIVEKIII